MSVGMMCIWVISIWIIMRIFLNVFSIPFLRFIIVSLVVFNFFYWPIYPRREERMRYLYWIHWSVVFGLLIGLPFHAKVWSLFWMIIFSMSFFGTLILIIVQDARNKGKNDLDSGETSLLTE